MLSGRFSRNKSPNIVLIGPQRAGKSALFAKSFDLEIADIYDPSSTINFRTKLFDTSEKTTKIKISDLPGHPGLRAIQDTYYSNATAFMVVLDLTDETSVANLQQYYDEIKELDRDKKSPRPIIVVGTKSDLISMIDPTVVALHNKAKELKCKFIKTSAKTGHNIQNAFDLGYEAICEYNHTRIQSQRANPITPELIAEVKHNIEVMEDIRAHKFVNLILRHRYKIIFSILAALAVAIGIVTGGAVPAIAMGVAGLIGVSYAVGAGLGTAASILAGSIVGTLIGAILDTFLNRKKDTAVAIQPIAGSTADINAAIPATIDSENNFLLKSSVALDIYSAEEIAGDDILPTQEPPRDASLSPRR